MKILAVSGSLRRHSTTSRMLNTLSVLAAGHKLDMPVFTLESLPMYDPEADQKGILPDAVSNWRRQIRLADGVLFGCPEYAHSIPGVLKNALDWLVSDGSLYKKPVAVTNAYVNRERGFKALAVLLQSLRAMDARITGNTQARYAATVKGSVKKLVSDLVAAAED